jgi:hypothetical protein
VIGDIHIYRGPVMKEQPSNPPQQRSAAWCDLCQKRRVQDLVVMVPVMDPEKMREDEMMAAAFCGPYFRWKCPCGNKILAPGWEAEGW